MKIEIQARGFRLTDALREHTERRLRVAFGSTIDRVRRIQVRLADDNGPRGGIDKRCALRISEGGRPPMLIDHHEADLYVAIDRAADRAGRSFARRLGRSTGGRRITGVRFEGGREPFPAAASD